MWKEEPHSTFWTGNDGGTLWGGEHVTATPVLSRSVWALPSLHSKIASELEASGTQSGISPPSRAGGGSWASVPESKGRWPILP